MLIKAKVENFKSFDKSTELVMIPTGKIRNNPEHKIKIKSTHLLKSAVIYGANASGKSNLIEFFHFFKTCVKNALPIESAKMFCKNQLENELKESSFELQFTVDDTFYAYGFSAVLSKGKFVSEWLYELMQDGSAKCIYEREAGNKPVLNPSITLTSNEKLKFATYADDFEDNDTTLFLTEMNRNKKIGTNSKLIFFKKIYDWITNNIIVISPDMPMNFNYYYDEKSLELVNKIIETFDTGISKVKIEEITLDELEKYLSKNVYEKIIDNIKERIQEKNIKSARLSMRSDSHFFNIELSKDSEPKVTTIKMNHGKSIFEFNFDEESDGTRRIFDLLDMLLNSSEDIVYIVDELERSLHPKLTSHFIELFFKIHENSRKQLIFTTHESSIMEQDLFRRDEIWFIERDSENSSKLYSLDIFKERYDKKLSKAYLDGRYGAIPIFSSFDFAGEG